MNHHEAKCIKFFSFFFPSLMPKLTKIYITKNILGYRYFLFFKS